jgi:hypothetical protein
MAIYVERRMHVPLEAVWSHTQDPTLHERWDLRFTDIAYLPRDDDSSPQRFRFATRLGFGLAVEGTGETVGERHLADGSHASALRFGSGQARSLIRDGSGYWKYVPDGDGVRFITAYDYGVRWGRLGRMIDRLAFRPLIGWATAWSFDRLALWLEEGIDPAAAARRSLVHAVAQVVLLALATGASLPRPPVERAWLVAAVAAAGAVVLAARHGTPRATRCLRRPGASIAGRATVAAGSG